MVQARSYPQAVDLWENEGHKVIECVKTKVTAGHCPNKVMRQVCTTRAQIRNFYLGTSVKEEKRKTKQS